MTVSVVIPVYNDQAGLDKCLSLLCEQDFPVASIEVIVVDNGSVVPVEISRDYPFRTKVVTCSKPGSYAARNAGVDVASGEILAFTDSDCLPDSGWLGSAVAAFDRLEAAHAIGGSVDLIVSPERGAAELYESVFAFNQKRNIQAHGFSVTANLIMPVSTYASVGRFDEDTYSGGDREWCYRLQRMGMRLIFLPEARVCHPARKTLRALLSKRRRVLGGQRLIPTVSVSVPTFDRKMDDSKPRGMRMALALIFKPSTLGLSGLEGVRVLWVAAILAIASVLERLRLLLGGNPLR